MSKIKKRLGRGLGSLISGGVARPLPKTVKTADDTKTKVKAKAKTKTKKATTGGPRKKVKSPGKTRRPAAATAENPPSTGEFREIPINKIRPNPYQPRREIAAEQVRELAESIRSEGLMQPIVVREVDRAFQIIAGERRFRACQELKLKKIPARVVVASDASSAAMSLIENLQREGLNPVEEALGYASLIRDFDLTQEGVSERVGKGRATVANSLRLLQLEGEIQGYLSKGLLSVGHAKVLLGIEDSGQRMLIVRRIIEAGLSVRELEKIARRHREGKSPTGPRQRPASESTVIKSVENQLELRFNTRVKVRHTAKKGRIVIEYYGNDDLQRILEKLGINA